MDWKLFPQTHVSVFDQEIPRNIRVSRQHLFDNVEGLLRRDKTDCETKQLNGLIASNERKYQVTPRFRRRIEHKVKKNTYMREGGDMANCGNTCENNYYRNSSCSEGNETGMTFQNKPKHSHCDGSTKETYSKELLHKSKTLQPTESSSKTSSDKERSSLTRKFSVQKECEGEELPSNGWWNEQRLSDSENEEKDNLQKTEHNGNSDQENTVNQFVLPMWTTRGRIGQNLSSLSGEDLSESDSCNFEKGQIQTSSRSNFRERQCSAVGQSSEGKAFDIFQLTRVETCPSKIARNGETCTPLLRRSDVETKITSNGFQFDDDLLLIGDQLLRYDTRTKSRITCKTIRPLSSNFVVKCRLNAKMNNSAKGQETQRVSPRMTENKLNKIAPVGTVDNTQRLPGKVNSPVKLRLKHRDQFLAQSRGAAEIIKSTDERMLPTTLHKSADASYSIMSPYMASVVWSVIHDEKSTITQPSVIMGADRSGRTLRTSAL